MFKGLVGLVTGAASGLGKATAEKFIKEGGKVVICDLKTSEGQQVADSLGENARFVVTDVRSEVEVTNALNITKDSFGKLDVLVNCAGISVAYKVYNYNKQHSHQMEDFNKTLAVNVSGTFNVTRLAVGLINENNPDENGQRGVVINTSGFAAFDAQTAQSAVAACCGAINSMTLPLARDLGPRGIRVCTIAPGLFDTPLLSPLPEKVRAFFIRSFPFPNRFGKPEEYADCVAMIVRNPMMNGTVIRLDAGMRFL